MRFRLLSAFAALILMMVGTVAPAGAISNAPVYAHDFPDPSMLVIPASPGSLGTYWAYSTGSAGRNLQAMSSNDLVNWPAQPADPLPTLPKWAAAGATWAPVVVPVNGTYLMYYTVRQVTSDRQCISVATSSTPGGPFTDGSQGPLVCQLDHFGSIDPSVFTSGSTRYLLWKSDDNAQQRPTHLWGQQLGASGLSLVGSPRRLLDQTEVWQSPAIEGPDMIAVGSTYYLFYGAGPWDSASAAIGYAICWSPLGPCFNQSVGKAWLSTRPGANGPSGPATFTDLKGATRFAYHAWPGTTGYANNSGMRALFIDKLTFVGGRPTLG